MREETVLGQQQTAAEQTTTVTEDVRPRDEVLDLSKAIEGI